MGKMDALLLRSKFRGSILGALMGDCLGSAYEGEEIFTAGMKLVIQRSFNKLEGPHFKAPVIQFTDDSAMTYANAESLIEHGGFDQKDMAKKFVKSFFKEPNRGYGAGVTTVFQKLRNNKFVDILGPAREQFNGEGSLGNGGAMRVAPVALFCHKNYDLMVDVARKQSQITHTHKTGVDGAILQAIAIHQSLLLDPKQKLDTCKFTDDLIAKMDKIEVDEEGLGLVNPTPYKTQLKLVKDLICEEGDGPHDEKVVHHLGNDVSALYSVPTAIYCFLRAQRPIKDVETDNPLRRTIQYALLVESRNTCSAMKWSENDVLRLISLYKKYPCLWRKNISAYADNVARHYAYRSIHETLAMPDVTFTDVMMKIREIRRSYVNELKKALTAQAAGHTHVPIFSWFNIMHDFLCPYLDYNESAELYNINFSAEQIVHSGCRSVSKSMIEDHTRPLSVGDPRFIECHSNYEELDTEKSLSSVLKEQCSPINLFSQRNGQNFDCSRVNNTDSFYQQTVTPSLDKSSTLSPRVKYRSPLSLRIRIPRKMHSLHLSDYWSINTSANPLSPEVQFILSSDSLVSERSSSTIVCEKRSEFTSTLAKSYAEFGAQWDASEKKKLDFRNDLSVEKEARNSAVQVEFDEHDIFAQTIASCLREMDVETAFKTQIQIRKVINDHRLRKPETQSIRLLRSEISEKSRIQKRRPRRIEKSHNIAATTRPIKRTSNYQSRSGRETQQTARPNKELWLNDTVLSKNQRLKSNVEKPSLTVEPIITHFKRRDSISTSVKSTSGDKSISLGGDTDTIASMAGAIAGAFYGEELIKQEVLNHCESSSEFRDLADRLFELTSA